MDYDFIDNIKTFCCKKDHEKKEKRLIILITFVLLFLILILIGSVIFMFMFDLTWIDAVYTASLIITGINIEVTPTTDAQKAFIIIYSLLTVVILLAIANVAVQSFFDLF